jgi:hypothetical protein
VPDAPPVERALAFDMLRRGIWLAPIVIVASAAVWGGAGAASAAVAVALVFVNLVLAAVTLSWAARHSLTMIMGLVVVVMLLVQDAPWIDLVALGVTVLVTHLGLLFWELRYVSASLAFPALKPGKKEALPS